MKEPKEQPEVRKGEDENPEPEEGDFFDELDLPLDEHAMPDHDDNNAELKEEPS